MLSPTHTYPKWSLPSNFGLKNWYTSAGTQWRAVWVGPNSGLEAVKRKIFSCRESNTVRPACSPSLYRLSYPVTIQILIMFVLLDDRPCQVSRTRCSNSFCHEAVRAMCTCGCEVVLFFLLRYFHLWDVGRKEGRKRSWPLCHIIRGPARRDGEKPQKIRAPCFSTRL
jgi:hypothetical protein